MKDHSSSMVPITDLFLAGYTVLVTCQLGARENESSVPLGPITSSGGGSSSKALSPGTSTAVFPAKAFLWTTFDSPLMDARSSTRCPSRRIVADHTARRPRLEVAARPQHSAATRLKQQQHCKYSKIPPCTLTWQGCRSQVKAAP